MENKFMANLKTPSLAGSFLVIMFGIQFLTFDNYGQERNDDLNYDENKIPPYTLPDLLVTDNGKKIRNSREWETTQRPAILKKFTEHVYGKVPGKPKDIHFKTTYLDKNAINGKATRK